MRWRLIADDSASASFGLAADEYMASQVGLGAAQPTLRLYTYRSHCALAGRHQSVEAEINRPFCEAHGIAVNRRPTGGGAIIMGADQLGIALTARLDVANHAHPRVRELFANFSQGIVGGLELLGLRAGFGGKNDVEVGRKKIAGLGLYRDSSGGLLFHASVLVDLDIALMMQVLRTPFEKISDKALATVAQRVTTARREAGRPLTVDQVRGAICAGYARHWGVELSPGEFTPQELAGIAELERAKYLTQEWIGDEVGAADAAGRARVKAPGGLLDVQLTLAGDVIKAIYITGDFFAEEASVNALERVLRWSAAEAGAVEAHVAEFLADAPEAFEGVTVNDFTRAIARAVQDARRKEASREPYGCFVNP